MNLIPNSENSLQFQKRPLERIWAGATKEWHDWVYEWTDFFYYACLCLSIICENSLTYFCQASDALVDPDWNEVGIREKFVGLKKAAPKKTTEPKPRRFFMNRFFASEKNSRNRGGQIGGQCSTEQGFEA
jgi:hypothetical protein